MEELSIKIKIANRVYPLTVGTHEEQNVRAAAEEINKQIAEYERLYAVKDYQDLLAMVALKTASNGLNNRNKEGEVDEKVKASLLEINQLFDSYL